MSGSRPKSDERSSTVRMRGVNQILVGCAWLVTILVCGTFEAFRLKAAIAGPAGALAWFADWNSDTTLSFSVLLLLPPMICFGIRGNSRKAILRRGKTTIAAESKFHAPSDRHCGPAFHSCCLFLLSFLCSGLIGFRSVEIRSGWDRQSPSMVQFCSLPPAYHDEFSYLLQARTFLAGRIAWPPMTVYPDLFHQIHVLNEPTTASRYFPLTGLWLAPFERLGYPWFGHWLAGAVSCVFFYRSLLKLLPFWWAAAGGLLIAVSPGLAVFSNLLLAHHPTMLALSVFLWAMLRLMDSLSVRDALIAGIALTLAMLGRPMTAAGFGLPFGLWLLASFLRRTTGSNSPGEATVIRVRILAVFGLSLAAGFLLLGFMNKQTTGQWTRSAYQYYTETWTPSHRFGFNNAAIGAREAGPHVLKAYDRWASENNLTVDKARENVGNRIIASAQWTMGIAALLFLITAAIPSCIPIRGADRRLTLVLCSVLSLHIVHIPYWYDGILHWHYVFETAPLLLILCAVGLKNTFEVLRPLISARWILLWQLALVLSSLLPNWLDAESFWGPSRVSLAVSEQSFSRIRFEQFRRLTNSSEVHHPCLIMIDEQDSDPQLSYIVNPPDLTGDVLVCRKPALDSEVSELKAAFPTRELYEFDLRTFELRNSE